MWSLCTQYGRWKESFLPSISIAHLWLKTCRLNKEVNSGETKSDICTDYRQRQCRVWRWHWDWRRREVRKKLKLSHTNKSVHLCRAGVQVVLVCHAVLSHPVLQKNRVSHVNRKQPATSLQTMPSCPPNNVVSTYRLHQREEGWWSATYKWQC